jgi:hypothetical protein
MILLVSHLAQFLELARERKKRVFKYKVLRSRKKMEKSASFLIRPSTTSDMDGFDQAPDGFDLSVGPRRHAELSAGSLESGVTDTKAGSSPGLAEVGDFLEVREGDDTLTTTSMGSTRDSRMEGGGGGSGEE